MYEWRRYTVFSDESLIKRGVSQDSVLGPLLFLITVNDLPEAIPGVMLCQFVDDTSAIGAQETLKDVSALLTDISKKISDWCT